METSTTMDMSKLWRQSAQAQPPLPLKDNELHTREPTKVRPQSGSMLIKPKRKRIGSAKATRFSWNLLVKHDQPVAPALQESVQALANQTATALCDAPSSPPVALVLPSNNASTVPETEPSLDNAPATEMGDDALAPLKPRRKATVFAARPVAVPLFSDIMADNLDGPFEPVLDHDTRRKLTAWLRQFPDEQRDFLSPINYFELKYSQARGLTSAWRDPQKIRLAVAFGSLHGLAATNTPIPSLFLLQLVEEMGQGLFENYSAVRDEVAALVNPCLYYYESAAAYFERYTAKCEALADMKAQLRKVMEETDSIKQSSMSTQVLSKLRTSVAFVKHNKVAPNVHKRHNSVSSASPDDEDLVSEIQIKAFMDYMSPDDVAHMLLRVLDDKTIIPTLASLVDAMNEDQRMEFYAAYQKCMSADELYLFISREMSEKKFMTRQASNAPLSRSKNVHTTEGFVDKLRRLLCIDHIPPPSPKDHVFTPEEEHVLVTVAALMKHCHEIRNELSGCTLKDVIPIHSAIRNTIGKLLQFGAPPVDPHALATDDENGHNAANNNGDSSSDKPSPHDAENEDDMDDEEDDDFDVSERQKKKGGARRKTRKRKGAVAGKTKASRVMPLADVCSAISSLLCEKLWQEANDRSKLTLRPFMRQYFIRVYGLKSLALAHISSFKHSLGVNQDENVRASLFYWFLGCDESRKFSADYAFEFFKTVVKHILVVHNKAPVKPFLAPATPDVMNSLESIQYAWNDLLGDGCVVDDGENSSSSKRRMVTLAKAIEVTKLSFYDGNDREAAISIFMDELKEKATPMGMEDFLSGIMDCWLKCFESTVQLIRVKFREADKNGDGAMDFDEFVAFMQSSNVLGFSEENASSRRPTSSIFRKPATSYASSSSSPSKKASTTTDAEIKKREAARSEARMRREAISIYDSLTNDENIIDENAFIEYLLSQVQWLTNEEDAMGTALTDTSNNGSPATADTSATTSVGSGDRTPVNLVLDENPVDAPTLEALPLGQPSLLALNFPPATEAGPPPTTSPVGHDRAPVCPSSCALAV
ncbi:hypothetical protein H310_12348 [Aphanomyces invadans]|uniref:EF-hand domain-containing protein n=1 Tax=Aphanomyces invadans TaxID=157072 RepID=A0A024TIF3_9STRA|nr:hypothetical protein H310_12348 [Aphanomyces invadans]ETV93784.1 hypothetical protein H310_12348 [Aphanomyces invadans]|eukprot:XP_008877593.1 hypothetical protein H310_12348 [Aphanomyces invadans]